LADRKRRARERARRYYARHSQEIRAQKKRYRRANPHMVRKHHAAYRSKHRVELRERAGAYHLRNRERRLARRRERYQLHGHRMRAATAASKRKNPDAVRLQCARRRAAKKSGGDISAAEWKALKALIHGCFYCGRSDRKLTMDHVVPLSRGGRNVIANVVPCCGSCNSRKGTKLLSELP